jgi:hypothetical protein
MLTRLAAVFLSVTLSANVVAAGDFARPPVTSEVAVALPMRPDLIKAPTREQVREALRARREKNLAAFRAYRKAGVYPHNFVRSGPLNVWMDAEGHLCAAATMIDKDGKHDLVMDTAKDNNTIRLLDVTTGPLMDWILTSGFTLEEIDRIQAPMVYPDIPVVDKNWEQIEDAKLAKGYATTDAFLVKHQKAGLDVAVDRLMQNPLLARKLVRGV